MSRGLLPPIAATLNKALKRDSPGGHSARAFLFPEIRMFLTSTPQLPMAPRMRMRRWSMRLHDQADIRADGKPGVIRGRG